MNRAPVVDIAVDPLDGTTLTAQGRTGAISVIALAERGSLFNPGYTQGTFREHAGNIQGTFREHSGNIQGTFREHAGNIQGTFREHSVIHQFQGTFRKRSGNIQ